MKNSLLFLSLLLFCDVYSPPVFAVAKFETNPNSTFQQESFTHKKRQNQSFFKRAWQKVFPKKQLRKKASARNGRLSYGGGALILISIAAISFFINIFGILALIAWAACIALGVIGLFEDEKKTLAIIALSLALVFPVTILIWFSLNCCGP